MKLSFDQIREQLYDNIQSRYGNDAWIKELYDEYVIVKLNENENKAPVNRKFTYTVENNEVNLSDEFEDVVILTRYITKDKSTKDLSEAVKFTTELEIKDSPIISEAEGKTFEEWPVIVISPGLSKNRTYYSPEVIKEAVEENIYDDTIVCDYEESKHISSDTKNISANDIAGWVKDTKFTAEGCSATLVLDSSRPFTRILHESWNNGKKNMLGLSARHSCTLSRKIWEDNRPYIHVDKIAEAHSVDIVMNPSAGGKFVAKPISESEHTTYKGELKVLEAKLAILKMLSEVEFNKIKDQDDLDEKTVDKAIETVSESLKEKSKDEKVSESETSKIDNVISEATKKLFNIEVKEILSESSLPKESKAKIRNQIELFGIDNKEKVETLVESETEYLKNISAASLGTGTNFGSSGEVTAGKSEGDKLLSSLEYLVFGHNKKLAESVGFDDKDVIKEHSLTKWFEAATGQSRDFGVPSKHPIPVVIGESTGSSDMSYVLDAVINKAMLADYNLPELNEWRKLATVERLSNLQEQVRYEVHDFDDIPVVEEKGEYTEFDTPSDVEVSYTPGKYGKIYSLTDKALINDDVKALRAIPRNASRAAKRTLTKTVLNQLFDNGTYSGDSTAVFHADHSNLTTNALSADNITVAIRAMYNQTTPGGNDKLAVGPKYLIVPIELANIAHGIVTRASGESNSVPTWVQVQGMELIISPFQDDTDMWILCADPNDVPVLEVGFLYGEEEPALIAQTGASEGQVWKRDILSWKIRFRFGSCILNYRGVYAGIPA